MHRQEGEQGLRGQRPQRPVRHALPWARSACCCLAQVLSREEYACWAQSHLEAESSVDRREELLFQSAARLETNLHLLGTPRGPVSLAEVILHGEVARLQVVAPLLVLGLLKEPPGGGWLGPRVGPPPWNVLSMAQFGGSSGAPPCTPPGQPTCLPLNPASPPETEATLLCL